MGAALAASGTDGVRVKMCNEYCRQYNDEGDTFLNRVVTCDETWIHFFEPESRQQSSVWKHPSSPSPTKALISKSAGKVMAIIFCDMQGIILNHFVPPKTIVTGNYYATVIKSELLPAMKRKRIHLESGILLHHDNAPSHSRIVMDTVNKLGKELLAHPPNSPDLAICDFWLFPNLKIGYVEVNASPERSQGAENKHLREMSRDGLQHVFRSWVERWNKCKLCEGRYSENE